jgi:hypothetical protein
LSLLDYRGHLVQQGVVDTLQVVADDVHLRGFVERKIAKSGGLVAEAQLTTGDGGFEIERHDLDFGAVRIDDQLVRVLDGSFYRGV